MHVVSKRDCLVAQPGGLQAENKGVREGHYRGAIVLHPADGWGNDVRRWRVYGEQPYVYRSHGGAILRCHVAVRMLPSGPRI